jgi:hypothetical protein
MSISIVIILVILIIAVVAIVIIVIEAAKNVKPNITSFWVTPDSPNIITQLSCPAGTNISVQNADYGAPWNSCSWFDVTQQSKNLMDGVNSFNIPSDFTGTNFLNITDPCPNINKIYAGSYNCL